MPGSAEVQADWFIDDPRKPILRRTPSPFRPRLNPGQQQVRATIKATLSSTHDYLFETDEMELEPVLDGESMLDEETDEQRYPVIGFAAVEPPRKDQPLLFSQLPEMTPDSGSFILVPPKRRRAGTRK